MPIDNTTGKIISMDKQFDNKYYGLIVDSSQSRATYLPHVFTNISWEGIKNSLLQKADIVNQHRIKFYAYDTKIISMTLLDYYRGV